MELGAEIRTFLEEHAVLTLATVDGGGPWATPLFYASDAALGLYFLSDPATRHCAAIARDPRVSAAVDGGARTWPEITGLQLAGEAAAVQGTRAIVAGLERYVTKFPFARALVAPDGLHRLYVIRPRWLRLVDNARGLGAKRELAVEERP